MMQLKVVAVTVIVLVGVVACGSDARVASVQAASDVPVGTQALMVAFSDTIVEFTVLEDRRVPPVGGFPENGFSYEIRRDLIAEVTTVLYANADQKGLPAVGDEFTFRHWGWWVKDGTGDPQMMIEDGQRVDVGQSYFAAFTNGLTNNDNRLNLATSASLYSSQDGTAMVLGRHDAYPDFANKTAETLQAEFEITAARSDVVAFIGLTEAERQLRPIDSLRDG